MAELRRGRNARLETPSCDGAPESRCCAPPRTIGHGLQAVQGWYNVKIPREVSYHGPRANRRRAKRRMCRQYHGKLHEGTRDHCALQHRIAGYSTRKKVCRFSRIGYRSHGWRQRRLCCAIIVRAHPRLVFGIGAESPLSAVCVAPSLYASRSTPPKSAVCQCD